MTIYERALDFVPDGATIGLGSGRAAAAFVRLLGERVRAGALRVRGVPTSDETARLATECGVPLVELRDAGELAVTVDGADEVDPNLDLIKGYGRALLREKVVAAASKKLVILVGQEKIVPKLGTRGKLPVEVVPFALPVCERKLAALGLSPVLWQSGGAPGTTDNGNRILDCGTGPIADAAALDAALHAVPGVAGTGLFVRMAGTVLVGDDKTFALIEERTPGR